MRPGRGRPAPRPGDPGAGRGVGYWPCRSSARRRRRLRPHRCRSPSASGPRTARGGIFAFESSVRRWRCSWYRRGHPAPARPRGHRCRRRPSGPAAWGAATAVADSWRTSTEPPARRTGVLRFRAAGRALPAGRPLDRPVAVLGRSGGGTVPTRRRSSSPRGGRRVPEPQRLPPGRTWYAVSKRDEVLGTDLGVWRREPTGPFTAGAGGRHMPSEPASGELRYMPLAHPDLMPAARSVVVSYSRTTWTRPRSGTTRCCTGHASSGSRCPADRGRGPQRSADRREPCLQPASSIRRRTASGGDLPFIHDGELHSIRERNPAHEAARLGAVELFPARPAQPASAIRRIASRVCGMPSWAARVRSSICSSAASP